MDMNKPRVINDLHGLLKSRVGLAGKSNDDVGGQRWPVKRGMQPIHKPKVIFPRVLAIHLPQNRI